MPKTATSKLKTPYADLLPPLKTSEREALAADIKANGVLHPVVIDEDGNILDGHHRYAIDPNAPTVTVEGLSDDEKRAYTIRANLARRNLTGDQTREVAKTQREIARRLRQSDAKRWTQKAVGALLGIDQATVSNWFTNMQRHNGKSDPPPDARVKLTTPAKEEIVRRIEAGEKQEQIASDYGVCPATVTKVKQAAERAEQKAADVREAAGGGDCGPPMVKVADAVDWLLDQDLCDLLLTDPPYATDVDDIAAFASRWLPTALDKVKPTGRAYVCVGAYPVELHAYCSVRMPDQILVWTYRNTIGPATKDRYKLNWQAILYYAGKDAPPLNCDSLNELFSVQDINAPDGRQGDRFHEWQKPLDLADRIVRHATKPGGVVLDPFCCTGSFLLAASSLGRVALGCDISKKNLAIAIERGCVGEG
jgi:ParB-like chromosome segregation protein Spo0J